jgi:hypothetical protein
MNKYIFWKIIDLIIIHLGRNPSSGGNPPRDRNKIIRDMDKDVDMLEIEDI